MTKVYVPCSWGHSVEVVSAAIYMVVSWGTVVPMGVIVIVVVDAETPSVVGEYYRTIEVAVADEAVPVNRTEEVLEGSVTLVADVHVFVVMITVGNLIEVVVDAIYVVEVDAIDVIDE